LLGVAFREALAACSPSTAYNVTSSAPPPLGNWTDTSGAVWSPSGGFPGCATGDTAADTNGTSTVLIVNSAIPNPIIGLNLTCAGCTVDIQSGGSLTLAGAGTLSSATTIIVEPGGQLTIANGGTLTVNSGASLSVNGGIADVQTGGKIVFNGSSTVTNGGTLRLSGGTMTFNNLFTVQSSGTVELDGGTVNGSGTFNNNGTVLQNGGTTTFSALFNSSSGAHVNVSSGLLSVSGGGTAAAPHTIAGGATFEVSGGSYTMTTNGTVSGAGTLQVVGGTLSIGGVTEPANFTMSAGTLTGAGFMTVTGAFNWSGGTLTGSGGTQIAGTGSGNFNGSAGTMTLDGRPFDAYGFVDFNATANPLSLVNGAAFAVFGTFDFSNDGNITGDAASSFTVSPNGVMYKNGGSGTSKISPPTFNNNTVWVFSGTLEFAGSGTHNGSFTSFDNTTVVFSAPSATFNPSSSISSTALGRVDFTNGSSNSVQGNYSVDGNTWFTGAPSVDFTTDGYTVGLALDSGLLEADAAFHLKQTGTWKGGEIEVTSTGTFVVDSGATLNITGELSIPTLSTGELLNNGTIDYTSASNPLTLSNNADIDNEGLFDLQTDTAIDNDVVIVGSGHKPARTATGAAVPKKRFHPVPTWAAGPYIYNNGTFQKSAGSGSETIQPDLDNDATVLAKSGTMRFENGFMQGSGETTLGPGSITMVSQALTLNGGTLDGAGTVTGDVANTAGAVAPGGNGTVGTINVTGNYTQGASPAALNIDISAAATNDVLAVTGTVTLDGQLVVTLLSGFQPANGNVFTPMTFASRTGDFASTSFPTWASGHGSLGKSYTPTELDLTATVTPLSADLGLGISAPGTVNAGAPMNVSIVITNHGPDPTSGGTVSVTENFPAGATSVSGSGTGWSCGAPSGTSITCTSTDVIASGSSFPTLTISMNAPPDGGLASNGGSVSSGNDPNSANNSLATLTSVVAQADLSITKSGPGGVIAGQNVVYTVTVTNNGPSQSTGVTVSDPTPANLTFVSNSGGCTGPYPCSLGTLTSGQMVTITSTYSTSPTFAGNVTNTATVSSSGAADPNNANDSSSKTTNVGAQADLSVVKTGPASATTGQNVTYTVVVHNAGPSPAASVVVTDPTPVGIAFLSNTGACTTAFPCNLGTLNAGQSATITSTYTIPPAYTAPQVNNTATVSSATNDPATADNTSTATTTVTGASGADLSITKSGPASVNPGQNIVYTIAVTNIGPLPATGVVVSDATPAGLTFVSNSGGCTAAFPCSLGALTAGQTVTITSTFNVPPAYGNPNISNTASVTGTSSDTNLANNTATATTAVSGAAAADVSVFKHAPSGGNPGGTVDFIIDVYNNGPSAAANVLLTDPTPAGLQFVSNNGACTTPFPCTIASIAPGALQVVIARYKVTAGVGAPITNTVTASSPTSDPNPANNTSQASFTVSAPPPCPTGKPSLLTPAEGAASGSPVSLSWNGVANALTYTVNITGPTPATFTTDQLSASQVLPNGSYTWTVTANFGSPCGSQTSASGHFSVCTVPDAPVASVVGESTTGQTYSVSWTASGDSGSYELQEAGDFNFTNPVSVTVNGTSRSFTKTATAATPFFYRVRAIACGSTPFSHPIGVVVVPVPGPHDPHFSVTVPAGSTTPVVFQVFIPGLPGGPAAFIATADKPWIGVIPQAGIVPPEGTKLTISLDPSDLVNGTWTGTILVVYTTPGSGKVESNGSTSSSIPVSISLVTPVNPGKQPAPTANTLVIPTVGHLFGVDSQWQSDIRVANLTTAKANYLVTFTSSDPNTPIKQTTLSIDAGATTALDDIVRHWFGVGSLGDSANGLLFIQATDGAGRILSARVANDVSVNKTTAVSSRTYNTQAAANAPGTLGQFVPATAFANFIGKAGGAAAASLQSIQQIAQNDAYRTNVGLVEASGKSAVVALSVFDGGGNKLFGFPLTLNGGEQRQLNALLAQNNVSLTNGRVQVEVTGGDGRVQAYASVIDAVSGDPFLVSGSPIGAAASNFVVPAVGDLNLGTASWRSDVRIFNAGLSPQTATLIYFPNGDPSHSTSQTVSLNPGEVKALDSVVQSLFGLSNTSGALHVTTPTDTQLVVTARTFDQTANGTLGQFIPAVTNSDAVGRNDRSLQILQAEESVRYRTNVGIAEVTGKPATVEISVFLPDSKVVPRVTIQLGANESRQLDVLGGLGIGAAYNTRLAVRVTDGDGRVTAYGSVVDQTTQAPTFIPAQ
jgi:uncharacterized repeat protein (TIGR01451 family)